MKEGQTTQRPKDTEGVIRICKSKKDKQHNGQKKRTEGKATQWSNEKGQKDKQHNDPKKGTEG